MTGDHEFWLDRLATGIQHRSPWLTGGVLLVFVLLPMGIAYLSGIIPDMVADGIWRIAVLPPVMILYSLIVAPFFSRWDERIAAGIRPLSSLDDEEYAALVAAARKPHVRGEWIAFGVGVVAQGLLFGVPREPVPLDIYLYTAFALMFGSMGWIVYKAITCTRLSRTLARLPLDVDIFDISPFEPIGRQSLLLAMSFVGGTTLSLFFVFSRDNILHWQNLVVYASLMVVTASVFFINMWPTHRLLSQTKQRHLHRAEQAIAAAYHDLTARTAHDQPTTQVESTINTWTVLERRLKLTRTWPYNTEMLRALVITVLTPLAVGISRIVGMWLTSGQAR